MEFIGYGIALFIFTWAIFVPIMWANQHKDRIPVWLHYPLYAVAALGFFGDVLFNIVFATFLFLQLPDFAGAHIGFMPTLTERLRDILRLETRIKKDSLRYKLALLMCKYLLEPYDPNHCSLKDID